MPEQRFLPYRYIDGALELHPESILLDGNELKLADVVDVEMAAITLSAHEDWTETQMRFRVVDANEELESVVLADEDPREVIDTYVLVRGSESRFRIGVPMEHDGKGWLATLPLRRSQLRGALDMEAVAVRAMHGPEYPGRAFRKGERVGASQSWRVYVDDKIPMPGGAIEGEWRDFARDPLLELRARSDCAWYLDLAVQERPRLFLNEGIEGLRSTLEIAQERGFAANVRNALLHSLLQPILLALAGEAIQSVSEASIDDLEGWRRKLLLHLARYADDATEESQVEAWLSAWHAGDRSGVTVDLATSVQRHLDVGKGIRNLISSLEARRDG